MSFLDFARQRAHGLRLLGAGLTGLAILNRLNTTDPQEKRASDGVAAIGAGISLLGAALDATRPIPGWDSEADEGDGAS